MGNIVQFPEQGDGRTLVNIFELLRFAYVAKHLANDELLGDTLFDYVRQAFFEHATCVIRIPAADDAAAQRCMKAFSDFPELSDWVV